MLIRSTAAACRHQLAQSYSPTSPAATRSTNCPSRAPVTRPGSSCGPSLPSTALPPPKLYTLPSVVATSACSRPAATATTDFCSKAPRTSPGSWGAPAGHHPIHQHEVGNSTGCVSAQAAAGLPVAQLHAFSLCRTGQVAATDQRLGRPHSSPREGLRQAVLFGPAVFPLKTGLELRYLA